MNRYIDTLRHHVAENPPNYGDGDAHSILDMLFTYYHCSGRAKTATLRSERNDQSCQKEIANSPGGGFLV